MFFKIIIGAQYSPNGTVLPTTTYLHYINTKAYIDAYSFL